MSNVRQFGQAARNGVDDGINDEPVVVGINGRDVTLKSPGSGQLSYISMTVASLEDDLVRMGQVMNFLAALMDDDDARHFKRSLLEGELGTDEVLDIFEFMVEGWSSRPTERSSASSRQRSTSGQPSTAGTPKKASTRSRSSSAGS